MKPIIFTVLLLVCLLGGSCAPSWGFDANLRLIVKPYRFSIAGWEVEAIPNEVKQWIFSRREKIDDEIRVVTEYFSSTERIKALKSKIEAVDSGRMEGDLTSLEAELIGLQEREMALEGIVEGIIKKQIRDTLAEQGIFNPVIALKVSFPPVNFK